MKRVEVTDGEFEPTPWFRSLLLLFLAFFILSPYLSVRGIVVNGGILAVGGLVVARPREFFNALLLRRTRYFVLVALFFLAHVLAVGLVRGTVETVSVKIIASMIVYAAVGTVVGLILYGRGVSRHRAMNLISKSIVAVATLNGLIVLLEFYFPPVKAMLEGVLADATNIDYARHSFRFRGMASGGGASLAVLHACAVVFAVEFWRTKEMRPGVAACSVAVLLGSIVFIGRTGFVIVLIGASVLLVHALWRAGPILVLRVGVGVTLAVAIVLSLPGLVQTYASTDVAEYSVLFLYSGLQGLEDEGTITALQSSYRLPEEVSAVAVGIGNFAGSFEPGRAADPGLMKAFTAFGLPLAALFYAAVFWYLLPLVRTGGNRFLFGLFFLLLLIAEFKEPMLTQGYSARALFVLGGVAYGYGGVVTEGSASSPAMTTQ